MKKILAPIFLALIFSLLYTGCKKDEEALPYEGAPSVNEFELYTLSGVVVDETNTPLEGVTVTAHGQTFTTGANGYYTFEDLAISGNRYIVKYEMAGYFTVYKSKIVEEGKPARIRAGMISKSSANATEATFASEDGGQVDISGLLTINFPANNFITPTGAAYTGNVNVFAAYLDPSQTSFNYFNFGGDQIGQNHLGTQIYLKAFAGMIVELRDDAGNKLNLDPNAKASATFQLTIPAGLEPSAPDNIDIWSFDDGEGVKEMNVSSPTGSNSTANKTGGRYQGELGHFSFIGCELAYTNASKVHGHVYDAGGNALPNVFVSVGQNNVYTNEEGYYVSWVPSGVQIDVIADYFGAMTSQTVTPYGNTVVDLNVGTLATVTGTFVDCDGLPIPANYVIDFDGYTIEGFTTSGDFSFQMPIPMMTATATAYGNGAIVSASFMPPYDFGTVTLCPPPDPPPTGPMFITLTGGSMSFTGQTYSFTEHKYGYFDSGVPNTHIEGFNTMGGDVSVYVYGSSEITGTFPIGMGSASVSYFVDGYSNSLSSGSVTVTRYDPVYGLIEGNFSGIDSDGTNVTGVFSVVRTADY